MNNPTKSYSSMSRKPQSVRLSNYRAIVSVLRDHEAVTMAEISKLLNLSKTTISKILLHLVQNGLLNITGKGESTSEGGKRPILFSINPHFKYCIVLGFTPNTLRGFLFDMNIKIVNEICVPLTSDVSYVSAITKSAALYSNLLKQSSISNKELLGVSVFIGGIINDEVGVLYNPIQFQHWGKNLALKDDLLRKISHCVPIYIKASTRFYGYYELESETGRSYSSYVVISTRTTRTGIGGCIIQDGKILHGEKGFAGELGHMVVDTSSNERCNCGNYGCMEIMTSPERIIGMAKAESSNWSNSTLAIQIKNGEDVTLLDLLKAADKGEPFARHIIQNLVSYWTICIRTIIVTHSPQAVIIQGLLLTDNSYFLLQLRNQVNALPYLGSTSTIEIIPSQFDSTESDPTPIGAALFARNSYLNDPSTYKEFDNDVSVKELL